jgi:hypothetical protein
MVVFNLVLKIISENIKELSVDPESFEWGFNIKCSHCFTEQPNTIYFTSQDQEEMQKGHGSANFIMKCKDCKKQISIAIYNKNVKQPFVINCESGNDEGVLCSFECRGCNLEKWSYKSDFIVEAIESGTIFKNVEISDVWADYDEKSGNMINLLEEVKWRLEEGK